MRLTITNEYPADWKAISDAVKFAAGDRCIRCGHPAGDTMRRRTAFDEHVNHEDAGIVKTLMPCDDRCRHPRDGKMRALTVHHLDGNKANCRWWNLLALCQFCHLSVQARVIPERPWLLEHTAWFKPFVAGFYAFYYGRVEASRGQVESEINTYLAMGQPWLYTEFPTHRLTTDADTSVGSDCVVRPVGGTPLEGNN